MSESAYWDQFYRTKEAPLEPSLFAEYACRIFKENNLKTIFEWGCGNGRDALYFYSQGLHVYACDLAVEQIEELNKNSKGLSSSVIPDPSRHRPSIEGADSSTTNDTPPPIFFQGSFNYAEYPPNPNFPDHLDGIYSRFTLHAVDKPTASHALRKGFQALKPNGLLLIEVRSVKDELYGQGVVSEDDPDAWILTHYRRFVRSSELLEDLRQLGFEVISFMEDRDLAPYRNENPIVIRVTARKPQ